jgi:hypothetical protein
VKDSIPGLATSKPAAATFVTLYQLRKEIDEQAKTPEEEVDLIKKYEATKHIEVIVYIAWTMKKNQDKDSINCAYNFK